MLTNLIYLLVAVALIVFIVRGLPIASWNAERGYSWGPTGILTTVLAILAIIWLWQHISH